MLPEFLRFMQDYDIVFYGGLLMVMTIFMPGGLVRGIPALFRKVTGLKRAKGNTHA
jgi:branched-chain amino acid transport system permease protein